MNKEEILSHYREINLVYDNPAMFDNLSKYLDEYDKKIRANTIDEVIEFVKSKSQDDKLMNDWYVGLLEELKEQKNE